MSGYFAIMVSNVYEDVEELVIRNGSFKLLIGHKEVEKFGKKVDGSMIIVSHSYITPNPEAHNFMISVTTFPGTDLDGVKRILKKVGNELDVKLRRSPEELLNGSGSLVPSMFEIVTFDDVEVENVS